MQGVRVRGRYRRRVWHLDKHSAASAERKRPELCRKPLKRGFIGHDDILDAVVMMSSLTGVSGMFGLVHSSFSIGMPYLTARHSKRMLRLACGTCHHPVG